MDIQDIVLYVPVNLFRWVKSLFPDNQLSQLSVNLVFGPLFFFGFTWLYSQILFHATDLLVRIFKRIFKFFKKGNDAKCNSSKN